MLTVNVAGNEFYDEENDQFVESEPYTIQLEHSLVSLSKWESFYEKPFLSKTDKTNDEMLYYVKAMTLTPNVPLEVFERLSAENYAGISAYIRKKMTATWFAEDPNAPKNREIITAERIYYWMITFGIPFECQHWHLERLLTLIRVANEENKPKKKMNMKDLAERNRRLNEQRMAQYNTKG